MNSACKNLLKKQLELNEQAWNTLESNGVSAGDEFCLNFRFTAPNHAGAEALKDAITRTNNYKIHEISADSHIKNLFIQGETQPLKVSKEMLDQWVSKMVMLGLQYNCKFNGWWLWKYNDFAPHGKPCIRQNIGSIVEDKPNLLKRLAQMIHGLF